jgi:hypothetical protein
MKTIVSILISSFAITLSLLKIIGMIQYRPLSYICQAKKNNKSYFFLKYYITARIDTIKKLCQTAIKPIFAIFAKRNTLKDGVDRYNVTFAGGGFINQVYLRSQVIYMSVGYARSVRRGENEPQMGMFNSRRRHRTTKGNGSRERVYCTATAGKG